jgi:arylsulfatase A-like enzyme
MPRLDALSGQGIRFDAAMSQIPVTGPSHMTLFSGLGPWRHGALLNGVPVPGNAPLLATAFQEAGYRTGAFVSAFVLDEQVGLGRGFQVYDDDFAWPHGGSDLLPVRFGAALRRRFLPDLVVERTGADTTDLALSWLGEGEAPWFLWVHLFDPHAPYEPLETFQRFADSPGGDPVVAAYDGELAAADHALGRLLDAITRRGEEQNTLVVVAGDHGESLGEHDVWYDHGGDLFSPVARVPLAFRWPGVLPEGVVVSELVELTDLAPTVRSLLGLPAVEGDGMDLSRVWNGGEGRGFSRSICLDRIANREERAENPQARPHWRQAAIRRAGSLVVAREFGAEQEFWTLAPDGTGGFLESPMQPLSDAVLADVPRALSLIAGAAGEAPVLDPETRSRLEALGYVEGQP